MLMVAWKLLKWGIRMNSETINPIGDKVLGRMIDGFGEKTTSGGIIVQDRDGTSDAIRPRWFEVMYTGPKQKDVTVGEYVLVKHGRWSRGVSVDETTEYKLYFLDNDEMLVVTTERPEEQF